MSNRAEKKPYKKPLTQSARHHVKKPRKRLSESEGEGTCVVCAHPIEIYAVGHCDHYICFKCSTKIRLLCEEDICPVCRKELKTVVFSKKKQNFEELNKLKLIKDKEYDVGIFFADLAIIKDYKKILEHKCPVCPDRPADKTFEQTKVHLRKEHTLFYCEICLEHNSTFTSECKAYSRKDLATHNRIGDADDTSHRGHPLCKYCNQRFLDDDKLFHHLRTTHYYCHLCDNDESYEFYENYPDLRVHFREEHFLCEKGSCINEEFTSVFGTELDFVAHCSTAHKENKTKQQQKMERQIDLGFQYQRREPPPSRSRGRGRSEGPRRGKREATTNYANAFERESDLQRALTLSREEADKTKEKEIQTTSEKKDEDEDESAFDRSADFPVLTSSSTTTEQIEPTPKPKPDDKPTVVTDKPTPVTGNIMSDWNRNLNISTPGLSSDLDFPSLPSNHTTSSSVPPWGKPKPAKSTFVPSASNYLKTSKPATVTNQPVHKKKNHPKSFNDKNEEDFPQLNPVNAVLVGRGTGKHFEGFESFSNEQTSSVQLISAANMNRGEESQPMKTRSNQGFVNSLGDFPSLKSFNTVLPPPGFTKVQPKQKTNKSNNAPSNSFLATDAKSDFPGLMSSNANKVRAPPGFNEIPSQSSNKNDQKPNKKKGKSSSASKSKFSMNDNDFPSLPANHKKVVGLSSLKSDTAGTTLAVNPLSNNDEIDVPQPTVKPTNHKIGKKQKGFTSTNPDLDFPDLPSHSIPVNYPMLPEQINEPVTDHEKTSESGTNLNLGNVFDFPSLY